MELLIRMGASSSQKHVDQDRKWDEVQMIRPTSALGVEKLINPRKNRSICQGTVVLQPPHLDVRFYIWRLLLADRVDGVPQIVVATLSQQFLRVGCSPTLFYACVVFLLDHSTKHSEFLCGHVEMFRSVTIGDDRVLFCMTVGDLDKICQYLR